MKYWISGIIVLLVALAAWYAFSVRAPEVEEAPAVAPPVAQQPTEPGTPADVVPEPLAEETAPQAAQETALPVEESPPLPALAESDAVAVEKLAALAGEAPLTDYIVGDAVIPRIVATVDALDGRRVPGVIQAVRGPGGEFLATADERPQTVIRNEAGDPIPQYVVDPANYQRYTVYVEMLEAMDPAELASAFRDYQPLFEKAFSQMGYAEGDFDQRLRAVIDDLLATPEPQQPLRLIKPEAYYLYADEQLESLSAGQKALLRMGPDNAVRVKDRLRAFRDALAAG
jgi:hypothetical protein